MRVKDTTSLVLKDTENEQIRSPSSQGRCIDCLRCIGAPAVAALGNKRMSDKELSVGLDPHAYVSESLSNEELRKG